MCKKTFILFVFLSFLLTGCKEKHTHEFVDGVCSCGETNPQLNSEHEHKYVDGLCECGEKDPNYQENIYEKGKFTAVYYDYDGSILKKSVFNNEEEYLIAEKNNYPVVPNRKGYVYIGWKDTYIVEEDIYSPIGIKHTAQYVEEIIVLFGIKLMGFFMVKNMLIEKMKLFLTNRIKL